MAEKKSRLEIAASIGELLVAVAALLFSVQTASHQEAVNDAQLNLNKEQINLVRQEMDRTDESAAYDAFFGYQAAAADAKNNPRVLGDRALATAERIYLLRSNDPEWRNTIVRLITEDRALKPREMECELYVQKFVQFVRDSVLRAEPCRPTRSSPTSVTSNRP